ncbi:hypothetical protein N7510_001503 [Penicillium lagena]|uniref:uncharacterized protein n=1 Tax=Penicillium lagena TaxID=94218 RepID=UPI00253FBFF5|nr:uncharacterized protein N7510_001503 [Penicillium lagena]KAJ5625194.1 hypothetical protein N7510_001503 [Penicillium lagena]
MPPPTKLHKHILWDEFRIISINYCQPRTASTMTPFLDPDALSSLQTEASNVLAPSIDALDTLGLCEAFNREESQVSPSIACCLPTIASFIEDLVPRLRVGGRLIYVGAGNSGRVGFMDCSELPVTFSTDEEQFVTLVAGGDHAILKAQEGAEDSEQDGSTQLEALRVTTKDTIIGISASGRTPFVLGALKFALQCGALTAAITNTSPSLLDLLCVNHSITALVGPEFITGSTRLKAGSAAKQILNMISTCSMVKLGKTYMGLMIDVRAKNYKLQARGRRIIRQVCGILQDRGHALPNSNLIQKDNSLNVLIASCGGNVKLACAVIVSGLAPDHAKQRLDSVDGNFQLFVEGFLIPAPNPYGRTVSTGDEFFLSIDGGGTKCAVSIATSTSVVAQAHSGACNFQSVPIDDLLDQITIATAEAVTRIPQQYRNSFIDMPRFTAVWAGIAGIQHAHQRETLIYRLEKLFKISIKSGALRLTSDSALLGSCIGIDESVESGISVIAGTGSVATAFKKDSKGEVAQIGRAGGWGPLLGDQGSAFDIGKRALQSLLTSVELTQGTDMHCLTELESEILATMGDGKNELLNRILYSNIQPKHHIGDLAKVVTRLAFRDHSPDPQALEILTSAARSVVQLIKPLAKKQICDPSISSLVLSGALMNIPEFQALVLDELSKQHIPSFKNIVVIDNVSCCAAQFLARREAKARI